MAGKNDNKEKIVKEKIAEIEKIYQDYHRRINELNKKQSDIIKAEVQKLEQNKIEQIRQTLNN